MKTHELRLEAAGTGSCLCGSTFASYRNRDRHTAAALTDDVLDQYNAHLASLAQQGRRR